MANLVRGSYGPTKPVLGAQVNWSHPLAEKLVAAVLLNEGAGYHGIDQGAGGVWATGGNAVLWRDQGIELSGAFNDRIVTRQLGEVGAGWYQGPLTVAGWIKISGTGNNGAYLKMGGADNGYCIGVGGTTFDNAGTNVIVLRPNVAWQATTVACPTNQWAHVGFTSDAAYVTKVYLNGRQIDSWTGSDGAPASRMSIGGDNSTRVPTGGRVREGYWWKRVLSPADFADLYAEPYAFLAPPAPRIFYIGFAAAAQSAALGPATITLSATALTATKGAVSVALSTASLTLTPVALTRTAGGVTVALSPATITTTPGTMTVTPGPVTVALTPATLTLTPTALTATPGAVTLTLGAATLTLTPSALTSSPGPATVTLGSALIALVAGTLTLIGAGLETPGCFTLTITDPHTAIITITDPHTVALTVTTLDTVSLSIGDCP